MAEQELIEQFKAAATAAGASITTIDAPQDIATYLGEHCKGELVLATSPGIERAELEKHLRAAGVGIAATTSRQTASRAEGGITGVNFAIAATGTLALESTPEDVRLASTLPAKHFALLDPRKIIADDKAAIEPMRRFHQQQPRNYLAWITGPSRTADIERVLTIGVHGPRELHILLVDNLSEDLLER